MDSEGYPGPCSVLEAKLGLEPRSLDALVCQGVLGY